MIRVLVIDDSITARKVLSQALSRYADVRIVGGAADAFEARRLIVLHNPDVITLDLDMPRMNGMAFLEKLMQHYPIPVVVVSSATPENSEPALQALRLGAIDVVHKTRLSRTDPRLIDAIRTAATARVPRRTDLLTATMPQSLPTEPLACAVIAIGASTGGTRAIESLLRVLPPDMPPILIAQHLPAAFCQSFASRLDAVSNLHVRVAQHGELLTRGMVAIGIGDCHIGVVRDGPRLRVQLVASSGAHTHAPSADVLFRSVADAAGATAIGVLLTGMGCDGAEGLLRLRYEGALTVAESEETCVVFGMPRAAIERNAATVVAPLHAIPEIVLQHIATETSRVQNPQGLAAAGRS